MPKSEIYNMSNVKIGEFGGGPLLVDSGSESIAYTVRNKARPNASNMCKQTKTRTRYSGNATSRQRIYFPNPTPTQYTEYSGGHGYLGYPATAVATAKSAFGVTLGAGVLGVGGLGYINAAAAKLRPDLTTVSIPNFLLDIDDITSLFKLWKSNTSIVGNIAGAHLNYKFGWKPTIGDLSGLIDAITGLQSKVKAFEQSLNKIFTGSTTVLNDTITKSGTFNVGDSTNHVYWTGTVKRSLTAHLVWRPQPLAVMSPFTKVLRGLLDSLGFELNPRIIWDAIPFTFVLDWFFGIGGWLQNFKIDTLELPISYVDSYLQYKEELIIESRIQLNDDPAYTSTQWPSWVTTEKFFQRMPIAPDPFTFQGLGWRLPTLNQATLLVSLATVLSHK